MARVSSPQLVRLVTKVLNEEAALHGRTTLKKVTDRVVNYISRHGGYRHFGISDADILMALRICTATEVKSQFDHSLPSDVFGRVLPTAPPSLVQIMKRLPTWIAVSEGTDAERVPSLTAVAEEWAAHARLKQRKAEQTMVAMRIPRDVSHLLTMHGLTCLRDMLF